MPADWRVLVTGGSGFIGTNLLERLLADGQQVLNYDLRGPQNREHVQWWMQGDITEEARLRAAFEAFHPTHVVHLAARTDTSGTGMADYKTNTEGTQRVLDAVKTSRGVERLIVASTQFVVRPGYVPSHDEDYAPHTVYGQSKVTTEQLTRSADVPCPWVLVRPTTIWGPWDMGYRRAFYSVMARGWYLHPGQHGCRRSYGFVGNVVHQLMALLAAPSSQVHGSTLYVGDEPIDLRDYVDFYSRKLHGRPARVAPRFMIRALAKFGDIAGGFGWQFPITSSRYQSMVRDYEVDVGEIHELAGPSLFSLEEGVEETLRWLEGTDLGDHMGMRSTNRSMCKRKRVHSSA